MNISDAKTCTHPNGEEITDNWDIDRWENDGGRSLSTRYECGSEV